MTIEDRLNDLITAKADMKSAIESKGVDVTGGLTTYADAIRSIEGGGIINTFDLTVIGYDNELNTYCNKEILDDIEYSKNILDNWDPTSKSGYYFFSRNYPLVRYAPLIDTSNITGSVIVEKDFITAMGDGMECMFYNCRKLTTVPPLNTSNVINMRNTFGGCKALEEMRYIDTSNVLTMQSMFEGCDNLIYVAHFDTRNVMDMRYMFAYCEKLNELPPFDTRNVLNMTCMLTDCISLTSLPLLDCGNLAVFDICKNTWISYYYALEHVGGFKDLGKKETFSTIIDFTRWNKLTVDSVRNIINNLYDRAAAGYSVVKIQFSENVLSLVSDADIAIATSKGWTISS